MLENKSDRGKKGECLSLSHLWTEITPKEDNLKTLCLDIRLKVDENVI